MNRVIRQQRPGPQGDIITEYTYDAAGRRIEQKVTAGDIVQITSSVYDLAGRLVSSTDSQNLTTTYSYDPSGRITTVTRPGGATEITERYADGRVKSVITYNIFRTF